MAATNSSSHSTPTQNVIILDDSVRYLRPVDYAVFVLIVCVFIFGLVSWKTIEKFRHFKNFVLLNYMFAAIILDIVDTTIQNTIARNVFNYGDELTGEPPEVWAILVYEALLSYMALVVFCWLTVLCWIFYIDIVKVFGTNVNRRYLKSALFAWGAPLTLVFISSVIIPSATFLATKYYAQETVEVIIEVSYVIDVFTVFVPFVVNVIFYSIILFALFKSNSINKIARKTRFYIATLIFVLSGGVLLMYPLVTLLELPKYMESVIVYLQNLLPVIYFLIVKSNRDLWRVCYISKLKQACFVASK